MITSTTTCHKCKVPLVKGIAMQETYSGIPDFPNGEVVTMSPDMHGKLIEVNKCPVCGYSITI